MTFAQVAAEGRTVLFSPHGPGLTGRHCTLSILPPDSRIAADNPASEALAADNSARIFATTACFPDTLARPVFQPLDILPKKQP